MSAAIKRFLCASLGRDGRIGSRGPVIFRYNDLLYPSGVINGVQVLFAEIRGYSDYGVAATEFWSQLLYSGQDCSGASPNKQVVISNERKTSFNRFLFFHCDDFYPAWRSLQALVSRSRQCQGCFFCRVRLRT